MLWITEKTVSIAIKTLLTNNLISVDYSIKAWGGKVRFIQKDKKVISDFTQELCQTLPESNEIENKIIDIEKDKSFSKEAWQKSNVVDLLNGYKSHPILPQMLTNESLVRKRAEYKQSKKDRAYTSVDGFTQQLAVYIDKVRFWQPRWDTNERFEFAVNQAMEWKWKKIVRDERIENEYQSWKRISQLTNKQNE